MTVTYLLNAYYALTGIQNLMFLTFDFDKLQAIIYIANKNSAKLKINLEGLEVHDSFERCECERGFSEMQIFKSFVFF